MPSTSFRRKAGDFLYLIVGVAVNTMTLVSPLGGGEKVPARGITRQGFFPGGRFLVGFAAVFGLLFLVVGLAMMPGHGRVYATIGALLLTAAAFPFIWTRLSNNPSQGLRLLDGVFAVGILIAVGVSIAIIVQ